MLGPGPRRLGILYKLKIATHLSIYPIIDTYTFDTYTFNIDTFDTYTFDIDTYNFMKSTPEISFCGAHYIDDVLLSKPISGLNFRPD